MRELSIDIETYSSEPLKTAGLYRYVESPDFEIILFAWAFDDEPIQCVGDMRLLPKEVMDALTDPKVLKTAHNAAFEITCIEAHFNIKLDPMQWHCTMVRATMLGLPAGLDAVGRALNLETSKDAAGKALIKYFCQPCKPTRVNRMRTRNMNKHDILKWDLFMQYCKTDVQQERLIKRKLPMPKITEEERLIWILDQKINRLGVAIDIDLVTSALKIAEEHKEICTKRAIELTQLANPSSTAQIKGWLESALGEPIESLNKKVIPGLRDKLPKGVAQEVLFLREELSKTSVKKYAAMERAVSEDGRAKGLHQYYGAGRTGRWAGRIIQPQNLPRNTMGMLDEAREMVKAGNLEDISMLWNSPPDVLSQLIRTAFVAKPGHVLISSDFSAIEARVTAWLAGEAWRIDVFNSHGKIYEASASAMFKVPIESIGKGSDLRQRGKVSELALGFGGGPEALKRMGALDMDFMKKFAKQVEMNWVKLAALSTAMESPEKDTYVMERQTSELAKLVKIWRNANKQIVKYWAGLEDAAIEAVAVPSTTCEFRGITFQVRGDVLYAKLPSGRELVYRSPRLMPGKFEGTQSLTYLGVDQFTKRWERISTYGGKLTENVVQAIARDLLAWAMLRLDRKGFDIVMHVHDEVVMEVLKKFAASSVILINKIMAEQPPWAKGLPLSAESTINEYYKKD